MNSSEKDMDFSDSLASSDEFNRTIGCIEDIVISPEFQVRCLVRFLVFFVELIFLNYSLETATPNEFLE